VVIHFKVTYFWDEANSNKGYSYLKTQAKEGNNDSRSELFDLKIPIAFGYVRSGSKETLATHFKTFAVRVHERVKRRTKNVKR